MDSYAMGFAVGQVIGGLIGGMFGALIGALFVQLATRITAGFKPAYWQAWRASYFSFVASILVGFGFGFFLGPAVATVSGIIGLTITGFIIQALIYGNVIKDSDLDPIGFGRACLVTVVQVLITVALIGAVVGVIFVVAGSSQTSSNKEENGSAAARLQALVNSIPLKATGAQPKPDPAVLEATATAPTPASASPALSPQPTPHPAVASRKAAAAMYPGLMVANSPLNQRFLSIYREALVQEPNLMARADWPEVLARRAIGLQGGEQARAK